MIITLRYKRLQEKVNGEYPYQGTFEIAEAKEPFDSASFKQLVVRMHEILTQFPDIDRIIFQRDDRPGIVPFELGPQTIRELRTDPLTAYRSMSFNPEPSVSVTGLSVGNTFSRHVYVCVRDGKVEDPITGTWRTLAYGTKQGWKIRGVGNNSAAWLPLVALVDDAPDGVVSIERIVFARWALVDVEDLLRTESTHFYLPRPWNLNGPWISREELQHMYSRSKESIS